MKPRITKRTITATLMFPDRKRKRFVVYRTAGKVTRKTSVRYGYNLTFMEAKFKAIVMACKLKAFPGEKLSEFTFHK